MSGEYKIINGSFHEKIYKILHKVREERPVIAVCVAPHRAFSIEMIVKSAGFRCVFLQCDAEGLLHLPEKMIVILDSSFFMDKDIVTLKKNLNIFYKIPHFILSLDEAHFSSPKETIKIISHCIKAKPALIVHNMMEAQADFIISRCKLAARRLFMRTSYAPTLIQTSSAGDNVIINYQSHFVTGQDNIIHTMVCDPFLYAVFAGAVLSLEEDASMAALSAMVCLRAASRRALSVTNGPGSFLSIFIDSLFHLKRDYIYQIHFENMYANILEMA